MNSDTIEIIEHLAKETGALVKCSLCRNYYLDAWDGKAKGFTFARATQAWKRGDRAFRGMKREQAMSAVKSVLDSAPSQCPSCETD